MLSILVLGATCMNLDELRRNFLRLSNSDTIEDASELIDTFCNFFLVVIKNHHSELNKTTEERQAKLVLQMMLTKALHVKKLLEGVEFSSKSGVQLHNIIDPTVLASIIRNTYETGAMFNVIYRSNSGEARTIVHKLWTIAGLKYRQRFSAQASTEESVQKMESEKKQIEDLISEVKTSEVYKNLPVTESQKIDKQIKEKSFLTLIDRNKVKNLHWQEVSNVMGVLEDRFENMYTYFSLYSHPSNVSVWQFGDMFTKDEKHFLFLTGFHLQYFFMCVSIFTADYINLFPEVKQLYNNLPLLDQIVMDSFNIFTRGYNFSINNSWKELG